MLLAARNGFAVRRKEDLTKYPGTVFVITMGDSETFSFPVYCSGSTTVDWGDESATTYSAGGQTIWHTYVAAGTYTIKISDTISRYGNLNSSTKSFPMQIVKFGDSPAVVARYGFRWYKGLTSIGSFAGVTQLNSDNTGACFYECTSLSSIGDGPNLKGIDYASFSTCWKLGTIGKFPLVTYLSGFSFMRTGTISIEKDTFPSATWIYNANTFYGSGITKAEFPSLTSISNVSGVEGAQTFRDCTKLTLFRAPNLHIFPTRMMWNCTALEVCKAGLLDTVGNGSYYDVFYNTPARMRVWVKNTMASLRAFAGFPWSANNGAIFYCSDGYISRINGTWTNTPYTLVSDLPPTGDEAYEFLVGDTTYIWNGAEYQGKVLT